jgi:hypothetical protein
MDRARSERFGDFENCAFDHVQIVAEAGQPLATSYRRPPPVTSAPSPDSWLLGDNGN